MSAALMLALLAAEPPLVPPGELETRLATLEEQRAPIEAGRARASGVRIAAGVGYGLFAVFGLWAVIELVKLANNKAVEPLGGAPYAAPVPPLAMVVTALVFGVAAVALHTVAHWLEVRLDDEEEALDERERPVRRQLAVIREAREAP